MEHKSALRRSGYGEQDDISGVIRTDHGDIVLCKHGEDAIGAPDWCLNDGGLFVRCSTCEELIPMNDEGDVLDSSGRCDECRP